MSTRLRWLTVVALVAQPALGLCEDLDAPDPAEAAANPSAYEYKNDHFSLRLGMGLLFDYVHYWQSDANREQFDLDPELGLRDLRFLFNGATPWSWMTWTLGYMYDVNLNEFRFRQTGLKITIDKLGGFLFVGRTKEGFSTNKLMTGYYGIFNERSAANDSFIPILGDGVRWMGTGFDGKLVYNIGAFADPLSDSETFNRNDWQVAGRAVFLPWAHDPDGSVLHLAVEARFADDNDGQLVYRSKPESFLAQTNAVDTKPFSAESALLLGIEAYYAHGSFTAGGEYYFNQVQSSAEDDPFFHGGDVFVSYLLTGESHPYKASGAFFDDVTPAKSFFSGGPGAWELALRFSSVDLDSRGIAGGTFRRITPLVNWYVSDTLRFEAAYGYGMLDRDGIEGTVQFFQTRLQLAVK